MKLRLLSLSAAMVAVAGGAQAAPVSANTTAQANIVSPNQVSATRDLEFGTIARPTAGTTTVTVASAASGTATPSVSGGNGFVPTSGLAHAATFRITGTNGQTYSVTANTLSFPGAGGNLTNINAESPVAAGGTLNTIPASGTDDLFVGGRFDITNTTAINTYSGTLSVTVDFN
ncbi:MAG: DUF4402 domain-containing protein [Phenylobacterium sp.]|nr:DUF4402 domain-containing protein [Phenylobacterium sp.]